MRIALSGATGLVGRRICAALQARGDEFVVLTRNPNRDHGLPAAETLGWSPEAELDPAALAKVDAVIHLAGETVQGRWTKRKKRSILESRRQGTQSVVRAIRAAREAGSGPSVLLSASAIGWYGERGDDPLGESEPAGNDFLASVCEAWEGEAAKATDAGVRVCRLRFGLVLAPEGGALAEMKTPFQLGMGGPLGSGKQWWSWVHIEDLVRLSLHCLDEASLEGPINVTAPEPTRQRAFAKSLAKALGRPAIMPAPSFALKLALGEFSTELLTSKRVEPKKALAGGFEFRFPQLEPALQDLLAK